MRYEKHWIENAIGHCAGCGTSLRGDGLSFGALIHDQLCIECASDITKLVLAREGRVSVVAEFKSDPIKYLTERGLIDEKGRVRKELVAQPN